MSQALAPFMNHVDSLADFALLVRPFVQTYIETQQANSLFLDNQRVLLLQGRSDADRLRESFQAQDFRSNWQVSDN
jgi:hypothetical protein